MNGRAGSFGWRAAAGLAAVLVAVGFAERGVRVVVSSRLATAGAQWIWAPGALKASQPVTFYAVSDFELDAPPSEARLHLLADETYLLYVNGRRVGSGAYYAGAPLDGYRVDDLLRPGWNRVVVELRSSRGAGGMILVLVGDDRSRPLLRSDGSWRVFRDARGVVDGLRATAEGEPALVWQSPPTGGWGVPRLGPDRPTFDGVATSATRLDPAPLLPSVAPRPASEAGAPLINDFGREVTGYVVLDGIAGIPPIKVQAGLEREGGEWMDVVLTDGQSSWSSAEVRTLRYVGSPYLPDGAQVKVIEVAPSLAALDAERVALRGRGVFGVEPPRRSR